MIVLHEGKFFKLCHNGDASVEAVNRRESNALKIRQWITHCDDSMR